MPIYKMAEEMSYEEFLGWMDYLECRPIGWREDDRIFKVLQTQGVKGQPYQYFPTLKPLYQPRKAEKQEGELNMRSFQKSFIFSKMAGAVGGDQLDFVKAEGSQKASLVSSDKSED